VDGPQHANQPAEVRRAPGVAAVAGRPEGLPLLGVHTGALQAPHPPGAGRHTLWLLPGGKKPVRVAAAVYSVPELAQQRVPAPPLVPAPPMRQSDAGALHTAAAADEAGPAPVPASSGTPLHAAGSPAVAPSSLLTDETPGGGLETVLLGFSAAEESAPLDSNPTEPSNSGAASRQADAEDDAEARGPSGGGFSPPFLWAGAFQDAVWGAGVDQLAAGGRGGSFTEAAEDSAGGYARAVALQPEQTDLVEQLSRQLMEASERISELEEGRVEAEHNLERAGSLCESGRGTCQVASWHDQVSKNLMDYIDEDKAEMEEQAESSRKAMAAALDRARANEEGLTAAMDNAKRAAAAELAAVQGAAAAQLSAARRAAAEQAAAQALAVQLAAAQRVAAEQAAAQQAAAQRAAAQLAAAQRVAAEQAVAARAAAQLAAAQLEAAQLEGEQRLEAQEAVHAECVAALLAEAAAQEGARSARQHHRIGLPISIYELVQKVVGLPPQQQELPIDCAVEVEVVAQPAGAKGRPATITSSNDGSPDDDEDPAGRRRQRGRAR